MPNRRPRRCPVHTVTWSATGVRLYHKVAGRQRISVYACSAHFFLSLALLTLSLIFKQSMVGVLINPLAAYNAVTFGAYGRVCHM